ncbi:MAG: glycogen/starch synthase [Nanoarchaeota archaeon]|nr:glycogen/starch synthase [Nanoarchaeota archaeon]
MKDIKPKADILIEVSYEIVSKLGGIHTVIKTKAPFMKEHYGKGYMVVGLYTKRDAKKKFRKKEPNKELKALFQELKKEKVICHYGTWDAKSHPIAILIDVKKLKRDKKTKNKIMEDYWVHFLPKDDYHNNSLLFGYSAGRLIAKLMKLSDFKKKKVVVNAHEYMSGLTLLYLRKHKSNLPLVFTTHATSLGRAIAFQGENLQKEMLKHKKKDKIAYSKKLRSYRKKVGEVLFNRHLFEKACAKKADVFTTVSETTSSEAGFILDNKADVVTPNGLDIVNPPSIEEQLALNYKAKQKICKFMQAYFSPYYKLDSKNCLLFYTAGRNEVYTKGYDLFFEALRKLNKKLKKEKYEKNIFVLLFIIVLGKKEIKKEVVKALNGRLKKPSSKHPPNCLFKARENVINLYLKKNKLFNKQSDKVKILFYPAPVKKTDKLLSMHYKEIISGMDLGIFPSLYEPWGYTPLETAAMSTVPITTDVAGFGRFIDKITDQRKNPGIIVLKTKNREREKIIGRLAETMHEIAHMPKEKRIVNRVKANKLASLANWQDFSKYYVKAHNMALKKHKKR